MRCRALDATATCPSAHPLTTPSSLGRAIAGHQCSLLEGRRTDRLVGQTAQEMCHISCSVLFRLLRHHPTASVQHCSSGLTGGPPSHDAGRWMRKGRDLSHCPCLPCCCSISASKFGKRCDPCLQPTRSTPPPTRRDPLRSFVLTSCSASKAPCRNPRSSFHSHSPSQSLSSHVLGPTFFTQHKAHQAFSIGLCVCVKGLRPTLCSATGQRPSILSTNWPIRPENHLSRMVPAAGSGR